MRMKIKILLSFVFVLLLTLNGCSSLMATNTKKDENKPQITKKSENDYDEPSAKTTLSKQNNSEATTENEESTVSVQQTTQPYENITEFENVVKDSDYPNLIQGNLTKDELEFVLAYGPQLISQTGNPDYNQDSTVLNRLCNGAEMRGKYIALDRANPDENYRIPYSLADINRLLSSFSTHQYTEDNDSEKPYGIKVDGDTLWFCPGDINADISAKITNVEINDGIMTIFYDYALSYDDAAPKVEKRKAILYRDVNGKYRIESVSKDYVLANNEKPDNSSIPLFLNPKFKEALNGIKNKVQGFELVNAPKDEQFIKGYEYALYDIDNDGEKELIAGTIHEDGMILYRALKIFDIAPDGSLAILDGSNLPFNGELYSAKNMYIPSDKNGLYILDTARSDKVMDYYRLEVIDRKLVQSNSPEISYQFGVNMETAAKFENENTLLEWETF